MGKSLLCAAVILAVAAASCSADAADLPAAGGDAVFGLTRVHQVELTVAADDYRAMDPPPPAFGPGGFGDRSLAGADSGAGNFNFDFKYVPAAVRIGDQTFANVGLRYKGSGTYLASQFRAKRSFKLDFDRNDPNQRFRGVAKLNLNSGTMDPTKVREALAYAVFRAAGVPAPRTALAEVTLHVPARYDAEYLGLYTAVEQVDEQFLEAHFGDGSGLLLKPEGIRGLPHFGDDLAKYEATYIAKNTPKPEDWQPLIELARLVNQADESEFRERIRERLDVDSFVRFLAVNAMLASLDGFVGMGHNFYLYRSPKTGRFTFMPWDLDLAFGGFALYGTPEQMVDLSLEHPHVGENKLIDRLLAMPELKAAYLDQVRRLAANVFTEERLGQDLAALEELARGPLAKEQAAVRKRGDGTGAAFGGRMLAALPLREFIEKRRESVEAQLAGQREGYVPRMAGWGMGFGGTQERDRNEARERSSK
jgi:spore coat protein CotH